MIIKREGLLSGTTAHEHGIQFCLHLSCPHGVHYFLAPQLELIDGETVYADLEANIFEDSGRCGYRAVVGPADCFSALLGCLFAAQARFSLERVIFSWSEVACWYNSFPRSPDAIRDYLRR